LGAIDPWRRAATLVPDSAQAALNLGSALFHLDQFEDAIAQYRHSLSVRPNAMAFSNLGTVLFFLERYPEAVEVFEKSVALASADPVKWGNLGNACRFIPGREAQATTALERAVGLMKERLERSPGEAEYWARLAGWLANLSRHTEAIGAIEEALKR